MSDSDSELLTNNKVFSFQNESTTVSARGPNISTNNLTGISFRNNVLTSTLPRNYEWQRRAESNYDQRSMGYRRETSPASIASACDAKQRNFNRSYYRGMSSQRSTYNGRSGSPMSMRSIDSNTTMCASDIVMALNNTQFNKYDMRMIREAYNKLMKQKSRKRIEKRRNLKLFLKGYRRKSGYDSGELGSNSSMSSDDNRSTRTLKYKNNMSSCRSSKTDVAGFRRTIKESNMFNDCTDNIKQNRIHGMVGRPANINTSRSSASLYRRMNEKPSKFVNQPANFNKTQSESSMTLQDRFKNGFLLPSQRFNKSVAASSIPEAAENHLQRNRNQNPKATQKGPDRPQEPVSDDEEIFSEITAIERPVNQRKRIIDSDDDICMPNQKKPKVASPCKNMLQSFKNSTVIETAKKDFEFAKPAFPVRKSANSKAKEQSISISTIMNTSEQLISKSKAPLSDSIIQPSLPPKQVNSILSKAFEKEKEDVSESTISQDTTDLSMRPSFIKRKLFTQNMDVTENTNDILAANSPQNSVYGAIQKEKNRARKLVTSQYCLSRDIQTDENNLLDLIHKIVPAERMNATNQTNKTVQNKSEENDDKWDVTSIISTRNCDENVSDTFTDEDTVHPDDGNPHPSPKVKRAKTSPTKLTVDKKKSPTKITQLTKKVLVDRNVSPKAMVQKYVKTFWDTDFESDVEGAPSLRKEEFKENNRSENIAQNVEKRKYLGFSNMFPANKTSIASNASMMNSTVDSAQRLNNTNRNLRLCSHRNNKPNVKKTVQDINDAKCVIKPQSKESGLEKIEPKNNHDNSKLEKSKLEIKKSTSKNLKTNKETPKNAKEKAQQKKQNSKKKIQKSDEKVKLQNKKTDTDQSKPDKNLKNSKETPEKVKETETLKEQNSKEKIQKSEEKVKPQNKKTETGQSKPDKNLKTSKETPEKAKEKEPLKKQNSKEKIQKNDEEVKPRKKNKKTGTNDSKIEKNKELDINSMKSTTQNKKDTQINKNKPQNKKSDTNNKQQSNKTQNKKKDSAQLDITENNKKNNKKLNNTKNINASQPSDSIINEDSFSENNKSMRPVRSCRRSKQNETNDTTKLSNTMNMTLRSRDVSVSKNNDYGESKPATKNLKKIKSMKSKQSISDLSFSLAQEKPHANLYNTRLKTNEIDTSDVSFTLTKEKDSHLPKTNWENYAKSNISQYLNKAVITLTPLAVNSLHMKDSSIVQRPRIRMANRRYVS